MAAPVTTIQGTGSPEGVVPAVLGSVYIDQATGAQYVKTTASASTGWLNLITTTTAAYYDHDNGQIGVVAPGFASVFVTQTAASLTAGRAYLARFHPSRQMIITKIAFNVSTAAGTDDACDVGIYDSSYNRIVSAGTTAGQLNSTGVKTISVGSTTLSAGITYYAGFAATPTFGGSAAALSMTSIGGSSLVDLFGGNAGAREQTFQSSAYPLPSTVTSGGVIGSVPILGVRES